MWGLLLIKSVYNSYMTNYLFSTYLVNQITQHNREQLRRLAMPRRVRFGAWRRDCSVRDLRNS